ncbi:MAG: lysine--tRNA ligase [SAR202 cluster bacterium]|nr:lysine--tRNA ligase [SAR202 cluster bacterium]
MLDRGAEQSQVREEKLRRIREAGIDPFPPRFVKSHTNLSATALFEQTEGKQATNEESLVTVAGRVIRLRVMGKAAFLDLLDGSGSIQIQLRKDVLGEAYQLLKLLDLGDILGVSGTLFRTRTGQITIEAQGVSLLSKALRPPPDKWHGLRDTEQRYRQREADLIGNAHVRERFILRSRVIESIRGFFASSGFVEVETPVLVPVAAGAMAHPFITYHNALGRTLYLRIATELYLKRCVIGGIDKVFEIGRVFRNEGLDAEHNPEYTLLESYEAYADYNAVMSMVEELIASVAQQVIGTTTVMWREEAIELKPPWKRLDLRTTVLENSGLDIEDSRDPVLLAQKMRKIGIEATQEVSWGRLVDKLLSEAVEPTLVQPTFILDYPLEMSPLAKTKPSNQRYVERFEGFIGGMEIANAFTELNDPIEQRRRFQEQEQLRKLHGEEEFDRLDEDFLAALEYGMPPTGGLGMGIDRLVMLLASQPSIREVLLFPHLSWSQVDLFRAVDQHVASTIAGGAHTFEAVLDGLQGALPKELRDRVTDDEIRSRIEKQLMGDARA